MVEDVRRHQPLRVSRGVGAYNDEEGRVSGRTSMHGRNEFSASEFSKALDGLLRQLAPSCKQLCSVWVYASSAESDVKAQQQVQQWRVSTNALLKGAPVKHNVASDFDLATLAPATLKAPQLALKSDRAFAMLLPTDLLDCVALRNDGVVDDEVLLRMRAVRTVTLGGSGLLWIIHGADSSALKDHPVPTASTLTGRTAARMSAGHRFRCWTFTRRTPPATLTTQCDTRVSEQHRDVPFYDVAGYHKGESRFIVEQLLADPGPVGTWASEQLDSDAEGCGARRVGDGVLVYRKPGDRVQWCR